jgi:hypothetical protein
VIRHDYVGVDLAESERFHVPYLRNDYLCYLPLFQPRWSKSDGIEMGVEIEETSAFAGILCCFQSFYYFDRKRTVQPPCQEYVLRWWMPMGEIALVISHSSIGFSLCAGL